MSRRKPATQTKVQFVTIPTGPPQAPASLTGEALAKWRELVPLLKGVATPLDADALALYASTWATLRECEREIQFNDGMFQYGYRGNATAHPAVAIRDRARVLLLTLAAKFGLTPADRGQRPTESGGGCEAGGEADGEPEDGTEAAGVTDVANTSSASNGSNLGERLEQNDPGFIAWPAEPPRLTIRRAKGKPFASCPGWCYPSSAPRH